MNAYATTEWLRATEALSAATLLAETHPNDAASRAYSAAFHAVSAVLALEAKSFRRHSAVRAAVHRDLIREGGWPWGQA